jgi:hypothetical protein
MRSILFNFLAVTTVLILISFETLNKSTAVDFEFTGNPTSESEVQDVENWKEATITCQGGDEEACRINGVTETYWHIDQVGNKMMNETTPVDDPNDKRMVISTSSYFNMGVRTFYVSYASSFYSIDNKNR